MPERVEEGTQYGHIGYYVPHAIYPDGYHCDPKQTLLFIGLASRKNHMAVYLFWLYCDKERVTDFIAADEGSIPIPLNDCLLLEITGK